MSPSAEPTDTFEAPAHFIPADLAGEGEIIVLALKPSVWFVVLVSLPVLLAVLAAGALTYALDLYRPASTPLREIGTLCLAVMLGRLLLACWQWFGRTYVLTNRRIIVLRGVMSVRVEAADLARLRGAEVAVGVAERAFAVGSIVCPAAAAADTPGSSVDADSASTPGESPSRDRPAITWSAVAHPADVRDIVHEAIARARP